MILLEHSLCSIERVVRLCPLILTRVSNTSTLKKISPQDRVLERVHTPKTSGRGNTLPSRFTLDSLQDSAAK